jgi:hypothetical protein
VNEVNELNLSAYNSIQPMISAGMSNFQMQHFVIDDQLTVERKMRQLVMEITTRLETLTHGTFELEEKQIALARIEEQVTVANPSDLDIREQKLKIDRATYVINRRIAQNKLIQSEAAFFSDALEKLVHENYGSIDKAIKALRDPNTLIEGEETYWTKRLARGAMSDIINYGVITKGTIEAICNLPAEQQREIYSLANQNVNNVQKVINATRDEVLALADK